jgi:hypothetical protein
MAPNYDEPSVERTESFLFGGISPPNRKSFLGVLRGSAVKILFWTGMKSPEKY